MSNLIDWLKKNYMYVAVPVGAFSLYKIVSFFSGSGIKHSIATGKYSKFMKYPLLMDVITKHEAKSYDDHNYYTTGSRLNSYLKGISGVRYSGLKKDLSQYTVGEVMAFQQHARDTQGQLFATGLYQIIPATLRGLLQKAGVKTSDIYNKATQDKLGMALLHERPALKNYLTGAVADTQSNLNAAALDVAKIWASVGVPYPMRGAYGNLNTDSSYYQGGGDRAATKTADVQKVLRLSRNA
jgi:hypothetical protein